MSGAPTPWRPAEPTRSAVYLGATVIDGTGGPARPDTAIVVQGQRISLVEGTAEVASAAPADAEVVDLHGRYVIPGLIDTHQHLATPPHRARAEFWLRRQIFGGVTGIRDMADDLRQLSDLARACLVGEIPGPDIAYAALMAGPHFFSDERTWQVSQGLEPGGLPWMRSVTDSVDLPMAVAVARGTSARAIKIYADLDANLVEAITREAQRQGMLVWSHAAVFPASPSQVVAAGVDSVSHAQMLAYETADGPLVWYSDKPPIDRSLATDRNHAVMAVLNEMRRRGTILDATLSMWWSAELADRPQRELHRDVAVAFTRQAREIGVPICTGTDYESPDDDAFPSVHAEIRGLVQHVGMTPLQALRSATLTGAQAMGAADDTGTIETGKMANFVVLDGDPLADITNIASVSLVVKRGRQLPRHAYDHQANRLTLDAPGTDPTATEPPGDAA